MRTLKTTETDLQQLTRGIAAANYSINAFIEDLSQDLTLDLKHYQLIWHKLRSIQGDMLDAKNAFDNSVNERNKS